MKTKAENFFTGAEQEAITKAIENAEKKTSGEIAIMVVDESDSYREAAILGSVICAALGALALEIIAAAVYYAMSQWSYSSNWLTANGMRDVIDYVSLWTYIPLVFVLYFPLHYLLRAAKRFKLFFVGKARVEEAVRERAIRAFYEKGLYKTRDETGVLIFISLLEHRVWMLGDRGINAHIAPDVWSTMALELTRGIKSHNPGTSVCTVISRCGEELPRHFPIKKDDTNELPDTVLT